MSEKPRDKQRLEHMLEAAKYILEFTEGKDFEVFMVDKMLQFAVVKNFEIIGEAAYQLTKDFRLTYQDRLEWRKITAFRHILVHDYWKIDYDIVWKSIETKIPDLVENVKGMLEEI